jgi:hypothetical protein
VEYAIRDFYSVTWSEEGYEQTASVVVDELGFTHTLFATEIGSDMRNQAHQQAIR